MCGCQGTKKPATSKPTSTMSSSGNFAPAPADASENQGTQMVMVEYFGDMTGAFSVKSRVNRNITYRFANSPGHKVKAVFLADAEYLAGQVGAEGKSQYRIVATSAVPNGYDPVAFIGQTIS